MDSTKVVHLHLYEPMGGEQDFYFGSIVAIYDTFSKKEVGICYDALTNALRGKTVYRNKLCTVKIGRIERKKRQWRPPHLSERDRYDTQCEIDETGYPDL